MIRRGAGIMLGVRGLARVWGTVALFALAAALTVTARATHVKAVFRHTAFRNEPTIEELKARLESTSMGDRPHLCVQIAQKQLSEADRLYVADDVEKGQAALADVASYMEQARDYAIQTRKYQKQTEIDARTMTRKLNDLLHTLGHEDQPPVQAVIIRLQKVRDDLLKAMFPKGEK
jgi:hypothetical protein